MEKDPSRPLSSEQLVTGITTAEINQVINHLYEVVPEKLRMEIQAIPRCLNDIVWASQEGRGALQTQFRNIAQGSAQSTNMQSLGRSAFSANVAVYGYRALRAAAHNDTILPRSDANADLTNLAADELGFHLDRALVAGGIYFASPTLHMDLHHGKKNRIKKAKIPGLYRRYLELYATPYDPNEDQWGGLLVETLHALGGAPPREKTHTPFDYTMHALGKWVTERLEGRAYRQTPKPHILNTLHQLGSVARLSSEDAERLREENEARIHAALEAQTAAIDGHQELMSTGRNGHSLRLKGKEIRQQGLQTFNSYLHRGYQEPDKGIALKNVDPHRAPLVLGLFMAMREWLQDTPPAIARDKLSDLVGREQQLEQQYAAAQRELAGTTVTAEKFDPTIQEGVLWIRSQWPVLERVLANQDWPANASERRRLAQSIKELLGVDQPDPGEG